MPKRKGETDQEWMERLRAFRDREALFERVAAAKCYIGTIRDEKHARELELAAFLEIFHPEVPAKSPVEIRAMLRGVTE